MADSWYYDFVNMDDALKKAMVSNGINFGVTDFRYLKDIVNTSIGMFTYEDCPNGLTSQIIESALMFRNNLCYYYSKGTQEWILCTYRYGGTFNRYWKPDFVDLLALNGTSIAEHIPFDDIILVRDNTMDIIPFMTIMEYLNKIKHIEDDMLKMLDVACLPLVVAGNKKAVNQLRTTANKLGLANPFILGDDTLVESVKSFNVNLPYDPLDIYELRKKYIDECLASLGIYSLEYKNERLLVSEVAAQNDYTDFIYTNRLQERELTIKQLNARGCPMKMKETYERNVESGIEEMAMTTEAEAKAHLEGIKEVAPEMLKNKMASTQVNTGGKI